MQRTIDAATVVPPPVNEPVRDYAPGSAERTRLERQLDALAADRHELTMAIGGRRRMGAGQRIDVVQPHRHGHVLGTLGNATHEDAADAVAAAVEAAPAWRALDLDERAAVFLRAAELLAGPWRERMNAATMLGQSKTVLQAEIDAACELIDFFRFNTAFARDILADQPRSTPGTWNRLDHRPLEGFVYAVTPFNFTSIAGNLPTAPALMGATVVWKPSPTQQFAAHHTLALLEAAGLPPGVINMVTGDGIAVSDVVLAHPAFAGLHFTGSTGTFHRLWQGIAEHLPAYRDYPRIVGETGGKDFVVAHPSAEDAPLRTALLRGAFEYQGQKCSAVSRAYVADSVWRRIRDDLVAETDALPMGDIRDLRNFLGAVIDRRAYAKVTAAIDRARSVPGATVLAGGEASDEVGYFIRPTIVTCDDPTDAMFSTEYFGPLLAVHVYPDADYEKVLDLVDGSAPYALTGSVFATDRSAIAVAQTRLRYAAGNFYINDKPTGAVVSQQPFGGARASGTDDKAGSAQNLLRWTSTRTVKETFVPPTGYRYPHMG